MRGLVFLPINLIKNAEDGCWLRSLSYFVRLKALYKNNTHYNYSLRSLAKNVGCSIGSLQFHLKVLNDKGLIRYHGNNITFLGLKKLSSAYGMNNIGVPVDEKKQHDILRGQIIRFNLAEQQYSINRIERHKRKGSNEKSETNYIGLTSKGVGRLFGLSAGSGSRIRTSLVNLGVIQMERMFTTISNGVTYHEYWYLKNNNLIPAYSFFRDGNIKVQTRPKLNYFLSIVSND